jgi:hypothetical protein
MPASGLASVSLNSPYEITAGNSGVIKANVYDYRTPSASHSCRLSATGPRSQPDVFGLGRRIGRTSLTWRVTVPGTARPTTRYRFVVRCGKAGSDDAMTSVAPARARLEFGEQQVVQTPNGGFAYALLVRNPSEVFEVRDAYLRLNVLDSSGRIVESDTDALPFVAAGQSVWVGGKVIAGGEPPTRIAPSLTSGERWPRQFLPLQLSDARMVFQPSSYEGGLGDFYARATLSNPNRTKVESTETTLVYFDAAGRLLDTDSGFTGELVPGASAGISRDVYPREIGEKTTRIEASAVGLPE